VGLPLDGKRIAICLVVFFATITKKCYRVLYNDRIA